MRMGGRWERGTHVMYALFDRAIDHVVKTGTLFVTDLNGRPHSYGDGTGEPIRFRFTDRSAPAKIALDADRFLGEVYMNGEIVLEQGTIYGLLALLLKNLEGRQSPW